MKYNGTETHVQGSRNEKVLLAERHTHSRHFRISVTVCRLG